MPGSAVGDFHQTLSPIVTIVMKHIMLETRIYVMSVRASGIKTFPLFHPIVSPIIPLTKSSIHSMKFCAPVGFICIFLAPRTQRTKTITDETAIMSTFDKLKLNQEIPNTFSIIGASCSILFTPLKHYLYVLQS